MADSADNPAQPGASQFETLDKQSTHDVGFMHQHILISAQRLGIAPRHASS